MKTGFEDQHVESKKYSFVEYRMMYESAERVTERRISLNKKNYAVCIALVAASAIVANWAISHKELYFNWGVWIITMIGILGLIFSIGWRRQIMDYKTLNAAKFKVMEEMSPNLVFEGEYEIRPVSYRSFQREWEIMDSKKGALTIFGRGKALAGTFVEFVVPNAFIFVFLILSLLAPLTIFTDVLP